MLKEGTSTDVMGISTKDYKNIDNINVVSIPHKTSTNTVLNVSRVYTPNNTQEIQSETCAEERIVSAFDVANEILQHFKHPISTMKLHKLLYYCQAWNMVWEEKPLFKEKIEAWANGPVVREVFNFHRGLYEISIRDFTLGNSDLLSSGQKETVESVLNFYGEKSAQWLIDQTHSEMPWINARKGLASNERGDEEILLSDMADYYSSLS